MVWGVHLMHNPTEALRGFLYVFFVHPLCRVPVLFLGYSQVPERMNSGTRGRNPAPNGPQTRGSHAGENLQDRPIRPSRCSRR